MTRRSAGALLLLFLVACAETNRYAPRRAPPSPATEVHTYEVDLVEPAPSAATPVPVAKEEFQRAIQQMAQGLRFGASPPEVARQLLATGLEGDWLAEVREGKVLTLAPVDETARLTPVEDENLREEYLAYCATRGGGDCLSLFSDGPFLKTDDKRTLALALALDGVLGETRQALADELNPRAIVTTLLWTAALYLAMWVVPEPVTKVVAAGLTVLLVGWLGVETLQRLWKGWERLSFEAERARSFGELRDAGGQYAKVMGQQTARALVMVVMAVMGSGSSTLARRVRALPGFATASAQAAAQGVRLGELGQVDAAMLGADDSLAIARNASTAGEAAARAPEPLPPAQEPVTKGSGAPRGRFASIVATHQNGNIQVVLSNGQRWHLPRGKVVGDIPEFDPMGDELQAAAERFAKEWGPDKLRPKEEDAINTFLHKGEYRLANLIEQQARGRWVEQRLKDEFINLEWTPQGADAFDPVTGYHYEVLSGTQSNLLLHGQRMHDAFFRMIQF